MAPPSHGGADQCLCYAQAMSEDRTPAGPPPRTLVQKIWDDHVVLAEPGAPTVIGIDLHLVHEVTSPQAFEGLRRRGLTVRHPERTVATADHSTPTHDRSLPILDQQASFQVAKLERELPGVRHPALRAGSDRQGIVHVIGPELGLTQPGMTIVCGDSHTATHGAFGALAFGIGTSEVEMVLATQTLLQRPLETYEVRVDGRLAPGVTAKDIILNLISRIGMGGGTGHVFEYTGEGIRALTMEQRMTICNMSIEGGARAGLIAPDDTTFEYVAGRPHAPKGADFDAAVERWRALPSDDGAVYEKSITIDAAALEPMITYGTNPGMGMGITARVPRPGRCQRRLRPPHPREGARLHGPPARRVAAGPQGGHRLHRLVHEQPHQRPALGGRPLQGPARRRGRPRHGRARLPDGEGPGRARGSRTTSSAPPGPTGERPAARCASP